MASLTTLMNTLCSFWNIFWMHKCTLFYNFIEYWVEFAFTLCFWFCLKAVMFIFLLEKLNLKMACPNHPNTISTFWSNSCYTDEATAALKNWWPPSCFLSPSLTSREIEFTLKLVSSEINSCLHSIWIDCRISYGSYLIEILLLPPFFNYM